MLAWGLCAFEKVNAPANKYKAKRSFFKCEVNSVAFVWWDKQDVSVFFITLVLRFASKNYKLITSANNLISQIQNVESKGMDLGRRGIKTGLYRKGL